jgi:hypothetical protein
MRTVTQAQTVLFLIEDIHAITGTSSRSNDDDAGSRPPTAISDNTVLGSAILFLRQGRQMPSRKKIGFPAEDFAPLMLRSIRSPDHGTSPLGRPSNATRTFSGG